MNQINANGSALTLGVSFSLIDGSRHFGVDIHWVVEPSQRAAMIYASLFCRNPNIDSGALETETIKMIESGQWRDGFRFLGIPVEVSEDIPIGTVRLEGDNRSLVGEIINLATPKYYYGH